VLDWYPQGKTSNNSPLNLPGRWAWMTMEAPGFITLLYIMYSLPPQLGIKELAWGNWTMAGLFTIHYLYRAIIFPLVQPSMSPLHIFVWTLAFCFQMLNAISLGGWLAGYGPITPEDWAGRLYVIQVGMVIWGWGLLANIFHDDDLREIRRASARQQRKKAEEEAKASGKTVGEAMVTVDKVYMMPKNGLFRWVLYAHYLCEWIEWAGFWMVGGLHCVPARTFLVNEISTMLPRALQGKRWYVQKFGQEKVGSRKAIIPGLI
jgi:3-oxo-5-alpha-steroid 4-dehydrogenase 1